MQAAVNSTAALLSETLVVADTKLTLIGEQHVNVNPSAEYPLPGAPATLPLPMPNGPTRCSLAPPAASSASPAAPSSHPEQPILTVAHSVSSVCISNSHTASEDSALPAQTTNTSAGAGASPGVATTSTAVQLVTLCNTGEPPSGTSSFVTPIRRKSNLQEIPLNQQCALPNPTHNGPQRGSPSLAVAVTSEQQPVARSPSVRFKLSTDSMAPDSEEQLQRPVRIAIERKASVPKDDTQMTKPTIIQPPQECANANAGGLLRPNELLAAVADAAASQTLSLSPSRAMETAGLAIASLGSASVSPDGESMEFSIALTRLAEVGFGIRVAGYVGRIAGGTPRNPCAS